MSQPPASGPYSRPGQPGQYGAPTQQNPYGQTGVLGSQAQYHRTSQVGIVQYGYPGPQAQYDQQAGQPAGSQAASYSVTGTQQSSSAPWYEYQPSRLGPVPVERGGLVLKFTATTSSRIQFLVGGGSGLACLAGAVWNLIHLGDKGTIDAFVILLLLGLFLLLGILFLMSVHAVFDTTDIHTGAGGEGRDIP